MTTIFQESGGDNSPPGVTSEGEQTTGGQERSWPGPPVC